MLMCFTLFGTSDEVFPSQVYPEGTHFVIPWFERPVIYDVRALPNIVDSTSGSRDLQMVSCWLLLKKNFLLSLCI